MKKIVLFFASMFLMLSCGVSDTQRAEQQVCAARQMVEDGRYQIARMMIDSIHSCYPREVAARRQAKALTDSITYLESKATLAYSDSLLQFLLPRADSLLHEFRYEKNDQYQDQGYYVHRLLSTGTNPSRTFLQAYVSDDYTTLVKSYYFGATPIHQEHIRLATSEQEEVFSGANHVFSVEGVHEIMTIQGDQALALLNFISSHMVERIRVSPEGSGKAVYYLSENEKQALDRTYALGLVMNDIRLLEMNIKQATARINKYENLRISSSDSSL